MQHVNFQCEPGEAMRSCSRGVRAPLVLVPLLVLLLSSIGCGDYGGPSTDTSIAANSVGGGVPQGLSVAEQVTSFETTVYPLLRANCASCHDQQGPGAPRIAHTDSSTAWSAVVDNQKVNFSDPASSRLVRRLGADFHFCWSDCATDAAEMLTQILAWQTAIEASGGTTGGVDVTDLSSNTRTLADGTEEVGSDRFDTGIIARWDFKEQTGNTAFDTSGVAPAIDLTLEGPTLMTSYGIDIQTGRAIATADASRKLYDRIAAQSGGSQAYTVEAWIANTNTTQEGPARIISYSRNGGSRNFMLGQVMYQYVVRNRAFLQEISNNGTPDFETYDVDQDAQATLQHVVFTYDQLAGRRIYVDGQWTEDVDEIRAGRLWNWDPGQRLVMGDEVTGGRQWLGQIRFVAIYDRLLTPVQIRTNYEAGIGKRVTLAFDVSQWTGGTSTIEFEVTQLDDYSYLFCAPTFVSDTGSAVRIQNMRISLNGIIPVSGQGFSRLNALVTSNRQQLSRQCSIVGGIADPNTDTFQLVFEQLGIFQDPVPPATPPTPGAEDFGSPVPLVGVRDFARVNASMAAVTGVDPMTPSIEATYQELTTQLPAGPDIRSFVSANQVGVDKLGVEYCDVLVGGSSPASQTLRNQFFVAAANPTTGFGWDQAPAVAFADPNDVDLITDPLLDGIVGAGLRGDVGGFPARDQVEALLDQLIVDLQATCGGAGDPPCDGDYTKNIVKGLCTAVVSSGAVHIH
ncbi:MAG: LamG domain-containing protein [Spirochaetaceae bacterium]|nr:LamG domain-containing protein [Myxococcales bacterium]MCB9726472.1 LamG domain-containing protein [Spirochaetaceae bacterium]